MVLTKLNLHYMGLLKLKLHLYWLIGLREKDFEIFFGLFKPTLWTQTTQGDHDLKKRESNLPGEASIPVSCFAGRTVFEKNILFSSIHVFYINVHPPPLIVAPSSSRSSCLKQSWIYTIKWTFYTKFRFSDRMVFEKIIKIVFYIFLIVAPPYPGESDDLKMCSLYITMYKFYPHRAQPYSRELCFKQTWKVTKKVHFSFQLSWPKKTKWSIY